MSTLGLARGANADVAIRLYGADAFAGMRRAGRLAAEALDMLVQHIKPGVTTEWLDTLVYEFALDHNAYPAPLYYKGFPKSICTSINHVVCHGIPGDDGAKKPKSTLREGYIVNVDVTLILDGWYGDTSRMYPVGEIPRKAERLIEVTYEALMRGVAQVKPGAMTGDIGRAIEIYARSERCSVVEDFCGHGLGAVFHDRPNILHYRVNSAGVDQGPGVRMEPGMIFTIEPMINLGKPFVDILPDGWTAVTKDRELSAQFEHTVGVTKDGCEVFTYSPAGYNKPPYVGQEIRDSHQFADPRRDVLDT